MIIYFYLFIMSLNILSADSVSIGGRNHRNDLVPYLSSRLESLRKDVNSLKVLSKEPFVIQLQVPPGNDGGKEEKGKEKKRRRLSKKRFPKLKSLRKKHRFRRDVQNPLVETVSGNQARKTSRSEKLLRVEAMKPRNSTNHQYDIKTSDRQKELFKVLTQIMQKEKSINKAKELKSLKKEEARNSLEKLKQKPDNLNRNAQRHHIPPADRPVKILHPIAPKADQYTLRDLKADRERVEDKIKYLTNYLNLNDSVEDTSRVRRKTDSDRVANKLAKMFLTLSAVNGMQRKSKSVEEENDEDDFWEHERKNNPTKKNYSSNEERYKVKKWIEQMKSRKTTNTCPCMTQDYTEENDVFPLEQKLSKDYPILNEDKSSEEMSSETYRERNSFFYPSKSSKSNTYQRRYPKAYEDLDKKLLALTKRGRRKLELPMEDLELYRSRAKQILQNAEDILDKIKEEEEKRQPNVLLSQLRELTSRIQPDPRHSENDLMRLLQKNLGWESQGKAQDANPLTDQIKSFLIDPYEKAKALTDESTRKLSTYLLKNFGKSNNSNDGIVATGEEQDKVQIYQGQEPRDKDETLPSANLQKENELEEVSVIESVKPDIGSVCDFGGKKTDGVPDDAIQDPLKKRIEEMLREQGEKIKSYTESPELSEGAEKQENVAAVSEGIIDGDPNAIEGARVTGKDSGETTTATNGYRGSKDEVQGKNPGFHTKTEGETLESATESALEDLKKNKEVGEGTFSERDENDVTASQYLKTPEDSKEGITPEVKPVVKALETQETGEIYDKVQESLQVDDKVKETLPVDDKVQESLPVDGKGRETLSVDDKVKETLPVDGKERETLLVDDKVQETLPVDDKVQESLPVDGKKRETLLIDDKVEETLPVDDKVKETLPVDDKVQESLPVDDKVQEFLPVDGKARETLSVDDKVKETLPVDGKERETLLIDDKVEETLPVDDKVKETLPVDDKVQETLPVDDKVQESLPVDGKARESLPIDNKEEEILPVDNVVQETLPDSPLLEESKGEDQEISDVIQAKHASEESLEEKQEKGEETSEMVHSPPEEGTSEQKITESESDRDENDVTASKHLVKEEDEEGKKVTGESYEEDPKSKTTEFEPDRKENDVIASKHLVKEEEDEEVTGGSREEERQANENEPEKAPEEDSNENKRKAKDSIGDTPNQSYDKSIEEQNAMITEKNSKVEATPANSELENGEIIEKSLKESDDGLSGAPKYTSNGKKTPEEQPEGHENTEGGDGGVVKSSAENPTESGSEEQFNDLRQTLERKLEDEELEDKVEALKTSVETTPEGDKDLKKDEPLEVEEGDPSLRSADPEADISDKGYRDMIAKAENLLKVGELLEKFTDGTEPEEQENKNLNEDGNEENLLRVENLEEQIDSKDQNLNENENEESSLRAENPGGKINNPEQNSGEDRNDEEESADAGEELVEEGENVNESEESSVRDKNQTQDQTEDEAEANLNENETLKSTNSVDPTDDNLKDQTVLKAAEKDEDYQDSDVKNDEGMEISSLKTSSAEELNRDFDDSLNDQMPLGSEDPAQETEAEVENPDTDYEAPLKSNQLVEGGEGAKKKEETPVRSSSPVHQLEAEDEVSNGDDQTKSTHPAEIKKTNEDEETILRSAYPGQEVHDEDKNQVDDTSLGQVYSDAEIKYDENKNEGEETSLIAENPRERDEETENDEGTLREENLTDENQENRNLENGEESTLREENSSDENQKNRNLENTEGASLTSSNMVAENQVAEERENENKNDETLLQAANGSNENDETLLQVANGSNENDDTPLQVANGSNENDETSLQRANENDETLLQVANGSNENDDTPPQVANGSNENDETSLQRANEDDETLLQVANGSNENDETPLQMANKDDETPLEAANGSNENDETSLQRANENDETPLQMANKDDETPLEAANGSNENDETLLQRANENDETPLQMANKDDETPLEAANGSNENDETSLQRANENDETLLQVANGSNENDETLLQVANGSNENDETPLQKANEDTGESYLSGALRGTDLEEPEYSTEEEHFIHLDPKYTEGDRAADQEIFADIYGNKGNSFSHLYSDKLKAVNSITPKPIPKFSIPQSIGDIMSDLEGKDNDYAPINELGREQIDHFLDKIDEAEQTIKEKTEVDCRKECACADDLNVRSKKLGKYEIVKDFLHWMKNLQLNQALGP